MKLGRPNVNALGRCITAKQLIEWNAYAQLEPFDETRDDVRAAQITAMIFNMAVAAKDRKPLSYFLLPWDKAVDAPAPKAGAGAGQDWRIKKAIAYAICEAYRVKGKDV